MADKNAKRLDYIFTLLVVRAAAVHRTRPCSRRPPNRSLKIHDGPLALLQPNAPLHLCRATT